MCTCISSCASDFIKSQDCSTTITAAFPREWHFPPVPPNEVASKHQSSVLEAIKYILSMPDEPFARYCRVNGFNKTIRNYQYVVAEIEKPRRKEGFCPYTNKLLGPRYFRMSVAAMRAILDGSAHAGKGGGLWYEHAVPVTMVQDRLMSLKEAHPAGIPEDLVDAAVRASEVIIITEEEHQKLDKAVELNLSKAMPKTAAGHDWEWGNCHLARICRITTEIIGTRNVR